MVTKSKVYLFVLTINRSPMLSEMLESIQKQTYKNFTCIILDNGSTDDTASIVQRDFLTDSRFHYETWPPHKSEENFERAINMGRTLSEWFAILHDDDTLESRWLESAMQAIERTSINLSFVSVNAKTFSAAHTHIPWVWYGRCPEEILLNNVSETADWMMRFGSIHFPSILYRASIFASWKMKTPFGKVSDQYMILEASKHGPVVIVGAPLYNYRIHDSQDSAQMPIADVLNMNRYIVANSSGSSIFRKNGYLLKSYLHIWKRQPKSKRIDILRFMIESNICIQSLSNYARICKSLLLR